LKPEGFEAAPDAEPQVEKLESRALRLLAAIDENTPDADSPVFVVPLASSLGLSEEDVKAAWRYLADKQLIRKYNLDYTARLSAGGTDALERAKNNPDQPAPGFGSITYNTITIQHMENSSVQQAGSHSTQVQNINYEQKDLDDLTRAIDLLEQNFDQLGLDATSARKAKAQIETLKAQLQSRATGCGAGGAKGGGRGECGPATHAPGAGPGKSVTGAMIAYGKSQSNGRSNGSPRSSTISE
jgi:hypothetical protein